MIIQKGGGQEKRSEERRVVEVEESILLRRPLSLVSLGSFLSAVTNILVMELYCIFKEITLQLNPSTPFNHPLNIMAVQ